MGFLSRLFQALFRAIVSLFGGELSSKKDGYTAIVYTVSETGVATIVLNRPKKKNAFSQSMYYEVVDALNRSSADPKVKVCLLTGAGDFYSSGNDLSNFSKLGHPLSLAKKARDILEKFVLSFIDCKKPIVVAVNGPAIGIAVTTLGLCDAVFATSEAYFKTPFAALGQAPEGCSSFTFPKILGDHMAHSVLWDGKALSAKEACEYRLVKAIYSKNDLMKASFEYCEKLPTDCQRYIVKEKLVEKLKTVNADECAILQRKWVCKECFEALAKFLESKKMRIAAFAMR